MRFFFKLDVLDTPLRRPSGFAFFNCAPQPRTNLSYSVRHCQLHSPFHARKLAFAVTPKPRVQVMSESYEYLNLA